jgi:hypothetical protein
MATFIAILTLINAPIGYFICRRYKIYAYWRIVLVGLCQYLATALIYALLMTLLEARPFEMRALLQALFIAGWGALMFSVFCVPVVLLVAAAFWADLRRRGAN